jgi:uncharacterized protein
MKSSGRERKSEFHSNQSKRHSKCLIVDGYNVIARLHQKGLHHIPDLDSVRDELIDKLGQYQAYSGERVIVVFDAHKTDDSSEHTQSGVHVIFTQKQETADERIERLVYELRDRFRQITVATSDYSEQQVVFGGGALRIPAGELIRRLRETEALIRQNVARQKHHESTRVGDRIRQDVMNILEKWRRQ